LWRYAPVMDDGLLSHVSDDASNQQRDW